MTTVTYPFDPTGSNPLCRIVNEQHVLTPLNDTQLYQTVIPSAAPFFTDNAVITFRNPDNTIRTLTEGLDYYFTHIFISASKATAKPLAGSITFLDRGIQGVLRLTYQTLGGSWVLSDNEIAEILANMIKNPRTTAWEQVTELPIAFPVIDHEWDLVDMVGMSEVVDAIHGVTEAVLANNAGALPAHIANTNNPHNTTKAQVGLGSVQDFPVATQVQAQAGTSNTTYMTPLRTAQAIATLATTPMSTHIARTDNPHNTTKAQVGLSNVENYLIATQTLAQVGIDNNSYMTPLRTAQAIDQRVLTPLNQHIARIDNPHNVTALQLGVYTAAEVNTLVQNSVAAAVATINADIQSLVTEVTASFDSITQQLATLT